MDEEDNLQDLQNKVDRIKTLSLINNAHNLTPPPKKEDEGQMQVAIISALHSTPRLQQIFLEARGITYDDKLKKLVQITRPYMNIHGAWRLVNVCKHIAEEAEWSNFEEEKIPSYIDHFYRENLPYFTFWHEDYELSPSDFNYVMTTLKMFILASFYKAKGGKYINLLGKTYSEDFLGKILQNEKDKKKDGVLDKINPFKKNG